MSSHPNAASLIVASSKRFFGTQVGILAAVLYALLRATINHSSFFVPEPAMIFEQCLASLLVYPRIAPKLKSFLLAAPECWWPRLPEQKGP